MNTLQEIFDSENFKYLSTKLISQKIKEKGYSLTDEQIAELEKQIITVDDVFTIDLPGYEDTNIQIEIEEEDITRVLSEYDEELSGRIPKIVENISGDLLDDLKSKAPQMLSEHRESRTEFERTISQKWGKALELLEMSTVIATEAGEDFNKEFRPLASQENDFEFDVLTRLHARSCQVANEILTLLRAGYADGAIARWRTMHEISVVGFFIRKFGKNTAERYLLHDMVESYRVATQYQRYVTQLGYEPFTTTELSQIQSSYNQLIDRFGLSYSNSYGWAAQALGNQDPKFSDIERAASLEFRRPHYKFASHNVHANPKGVIIKLGLYPNNRKLLLAGPSDTGFVSPGHSAAISLLQITTSLLTLKPNIDRLCICHILSTLTEQIGDKFLSIQRHQEGASQP